MRGHRRPLQNVRTPSRLCLNSLRYLPSSPFTNFPATISTSSSSSYSNLTCSQDGGLHHISLPHPFYTQVGATLQLVELTGTSQKLHAPQHASNQLEAALGLATSMLPCLAGACLPLPILLAAGALRQSPRLLSNNSAAAEAVAAAAADGTGVGVGAGPTYNLRSSPHAASPTLPATTAASNNNNSLPQGAARKRLRTHSPAMSIYAC